MLKRSTFEGIILFICISTQAIAQPQANVAWQKNSADGFSGANAVRDLKSGRTLGIVACDVGQGLICYTPEGQVVWNVPLSKPSTAVPAVADVNKDGQEEIVAADGHAHLLLIDKDGGVLWKAETRGVVQAESAPVIDDLDQDERLETLIIDQSGAVNCFDSDGKNLWTFVAKGDQIGTPLVADLYDTPGKEIIFTSHNGHIYALNSKGKLLWQIYHPKECIPWSLPVLADTDMDRIPEVYIGGGLHHFIRIDLKKPAIDLDMNVHLHVNTAVLAADLDQDSQEEVVFGVKSGKVQCYGKEGIRWTQEFNDTWMNSSPIAANFDEDPALELLFTNLGLKILDSDGKILQQLPSPSLSSQPLAGDFDNDGNLDLVLSGSGLTGQKVLMFYKWNVPFNDSPELWLTLGGDRSHSRKYPQASQWIQLAAPQQSISGEVKDCSFSLSSPPHLSGGNNHWRFDIQNPGLKKLTVLTEISCPDGYHMDFSNHTYSEKERTSIDFTVNQEGTYVIRATLFDTEKNAVQSQKEWNLEYRGIEQEKEFLKQKLSDIKEGLRKNTGLNEPVLDNFINQLDSLQGRVVMLESEKKMDNRKSSGNPVENLRNEIERLSQMVAAAAQDSATKSFAVYQSNPWAYFHPEETLPDSGMLCHRISSQLCIDEYDSQALMIMNYVGKTQNIRAWCDPFKQGDKTLGISCLQLRESIVVPTVRGEDVADALPLLNQAGLIVAPRDEARQLWLTFNSTGLEPGKYLSTLHLKTVEPVPSMISIPIELEVADLKMPDESPLRFCVWANAEKEPDYILKDLVEHGVNVQFASTPTGTCNAQGSLTGTIDFSAHDAAVKRLSPYGIILFIGPQHFLTGAEQFSDGWNIAFVEFMREWASHLKLLDLGYDDYAIYPYDEPASPFSQTSINLAKVARLIRQADPSIQIYANPTSGTTMDSLKMWEGLVDIWCPAIELLDRFGDEILPFAKQNGKETWYYDASGRARTLSCLGLFRWRFWHAWNLGLTGVGWWTYKYGNYLWDGFNPNDDYFSHVYDAQDAIITSKRWEAAREGIEDYEILFLLKELIRQAEVAGYSSDTLNDARQILSKTPQSVENTLAAVGRRLPLTTDSVPQYEAATESIDSARAQILSACLKLKGELSEQNKTGH